MASEFNKNETMSDTPETNGMIEQCQREINVPTNPVPADFARKLERERDEWRQHGHREADMRLQLMGERDDARLKVERERDEIRAQLREEQQLHVRTLDERDEARAALKKDVGLSEMRKLANAELESDVEKAMSYKRVMKNANRDLSRENEKLRGELEKARILHAYANEQRKTADNDRMNAEESVARLRMIVDGPPSISKRDA